MLLVLTSLAHSVLFSLQCSYLELVRETGFSTVLMPLSFNAMFLKHRLGISEVEALDKENERYFQA